MKPTTNVLFAHFMFQSLPFPVVTLCNFNAIKYYALQDSNFTALKETFQKQSKFIIKLNVRIHLG